MSVVQSSVLRFLVLRRVWELRLKVSELSEATGVPRERLERFVNGDGLIDSVHLLLLGKHLQLPVRRLIELVNPPAGKRCWEPALLKSKKRSWLMRNIGRVIHQRRIDAGLTLRAFAYSISVPSKILARLERGSVVANMIHLEDLCSALGLSIHELLRQAMIVDDERILAIGLPPLLLQDLRCKHRDIVEVGSVKQALEFIEHCRFDCVLVDETCDSEMPLLLSRLSRGEGLHNMLVCRIVSDCKLAVRIYSTGGTMHHIVHDVSRDNLLPQLNARMLRTNKGRVCHLRRSLDRSNALKQQLMNFKNKLARHQAAIVAYTESVQKRYALVPDRLKNEQLEIRWTRLLVDLRSRSKQIEAKQLHINLKLKELEEQRKFIQKQETWLTDQAANVEVA